MLKLSRRSITLSGSANRPILPYALLCAAAFFATWTGVSLNGLQLVDWLLTLCALTSLSHLPAGFRNLPRWTLFLAGAIILVAVLNHTFPTSGVYLSGRFTLQSGPSGSVTSAPPNANVAAIQWLIAVAALPAVALAVLAKSQRPVEPVMWSWAVGAALSATVALSDYLGMTAIGPSLLGLDASTGRQSGLASHVNNLGVACATAMPIALHLLTRKSKLIGLVLIGSLGLGCLVTGSRGAQIGLISGLVLTLIITPLGRRLIVPLTWTSSVVACSIYVGEPELFRRFDGALRFGSLSGVESDVGRAQIASQAIADLRHSPVYGIGFQFLTEAHSVYLQLLATGGLLLTAGFIIFAIGAIRELVELHHSYDIARFALASVLVWLATGTVENQIADRYLYFPIIAAVYLTYLKGAKSVGRSSHEPCEQIGSRKQ